MESNLSKLKNDFNIIINTRDSVKNIFVILLDKINKLKSLYDELINNNNNNNMFVFGLDTFHFQSKLLDLEYDDMKRIFLAINNRIYCEYFKLNKIILEYIQQNISSKKIIDIIKINNYPVYKDLEPFKEYKFELVIEMHDSILNMLTLLMSELTAKENELAIHVNKQLIGLYIDNYITTFNFNNNIMKEKILLFINYIEFFHKMHIKYLKRFSSKLKLMYTYIINDIKFDNNLDINKNKNDLINETLRENSVIYSDTSSEDLVDNIIDNDNLIDNISVISSENSNYIIDNFNQSNINYNDFFVLKNNLSNLDTNELKPDNNEFKLDTNEFKSDSNELKPDNNELKPDNNETKPVNKVKLKTKVNKVISLLKNNKKYPINNEVNDIFSSIDNNFYKIINKNLSNEPQINKINETQINQINEPQINQSNELQINQSNGTQLNQSNGTQLNQSNERQINQSNEPQINQTNEPQINQSNELQINQINQTQINQINEPQINQINQTQINVINETQINQINEPQINQTNELQINQSNETQINQSNELQINQSNEPQINKINETQINQINQTQINQLNELEIKQNEKYIIVKEELKTKKKNKKKKKN